MNNIPCYYGGFEYMKRVFKIIIMLCVLCLLSGCGSKQSIDYGDAESFEAALNAGDNLEGKIVQFKADELHPQSKWGYNVWAGEHLNFVSSRNPDIKEGDIVVVKTKTIENINGSWKITYEKVSNAVADDNTIMYSGDDGVNGSNESDSGKEEISTESENVTTEKTTKATTETTTEATTETEGTYTNNEYYDVVEKGSYNNSIGHTIIIHKVLAKQDVAIDASMIAYSSDGSVIGKSSSDVELTDGEYNYFRYSFDADVSDATFEVTANAKNPSFSVGERNAVEMTDYNVSGNDLYITFKQTGDSMGTFAKYKILLYKGDTIVGDEDGYFSVYAKNLNGKDSTDVASILVYGKDFDRIEYYYEP